MRPRVPTNASFMIVVPYVSFLRAASIPTSLTPNFRLHDTSSSPMLSSEGSRHHCTGQRIKGLHSGLHGQLRKRNDHLSSLRYKGTRDFAHLHCILSRIGIDTTADICCIVLKDTRFSGRMVEFLLLPGNTRAIGEGYQFTAENEMIRMRRSQEDIQPLRNGIHRNAHQLIVRNISTEGVQLIL